MKTFLGIDTSCDDTSAAVVREDLSVLSNIVSSQDDIHRKYAGVVPELASRRHIEMIWPVVHEALAVADLSPGEIDVIAVCKGPGLIGSLLVGVSFAKALAFSLNRPLIGVNHLEGHIYANFLEPEPPPFPFLALVVSGGHTSLYHVRDHGAYTEVASTLDDAAGEAYDKVAKLLDIGFPGGPVIDRLSKNGAADSVHFPRPFLQGRKGFSFSGLKTAVLYHHQKEPAFPVADTAAAFQASMIDVLVGKTLEAAEELGIGAIALSGGVSANSALRSRMKSEGEKRGLRVFLPSIPLCTDNAAMIAAAASFRFADGKPDDLSLNARASAPLGRTR